MKKIQMIFAGLAIALASVGVFANTLVATVYYVGNSSETGANCRTQVSDPGACSSGTQCNKTLTINDVTGTYYFSKRVDGGACTTLPGTAI